MPDTKQYVASEWRRSVTGTARLPIRMVIVGGSTAGVETAQGIVRSFPSDQVHVTLIDRYDHHYHKIGAVRGILDKEFASMLWIPFTNVFHEARPGKEGYAEHQFLQGEVTQVLDGQVLLEDSPYIVEYDYLVLATGSTCAQPVSPVLGSKELAAKVNGEFSDDIKAAERVLIIGGGPLGVEMAGEIKHADPSKRVTIVHRGQQLLSSPLPLKFRRRVTQRLRSMGVDVVLGDSIDLETEMNAVAAELGPNAPSAPCPARIPASPTSSYSDPESSNLDALYGMHNRMRPRPTVPSMSRKASTINTEVTATMNGHQHHHHRTGSYATSTHTAPGHDTSSNSVDPHGGAPVPTSPAAHVITTRKGIRIETDKILNAVGNQVHTEYLHSLPTDTRMGIVGPDDRIRVYPTLQVKDDKYPYIFAVGDANDIKCGKAGCRATHQVRILVKNLRLCITTELRNLDSVKRPELPRLHNFEDSEGYLVLALGPAKGICLFPHGLVFGNWAARAFKGRDLQLAKKWRQMGLPVPPRLTAKTGGASTGVIPMSLFAGRDTTAAASTVNVDVGSDQE